ncbi:MAG: hypothetical protein ACOCYN_04820 [Planctomycetota bacterium]
MSRITSRLVLAALLCCCLAPAVAADHSDIAAQLSAALADTDAQAKQRAIARVRSIPDKEVAFPLLIRAAGDRQARSVALKALAGLAGVSPRSRPDTHGNVGPGYPGHPKQNTAAGWQSWFSQWKKEQDEKERLAELQKQLEEAAAKEEEKAKAEAEGEVADADADAENDDADGEQLAEEAEPVARPPSPEDRHGKLDRIILKRGGIRMGYIVTKRQDLQGNITSIVLAHRDGGGREVLDMALIARIEEDIR